MTGRCLPTLLLLSCATAQSAVPATVLDLQPFRRTASVTLQDATGGRAVATLINLSPAVGAWYVLMLPGGQGESVSYHLESPDTAGQPLQLEVDESGALALTGGASRCEVWSPSQGAGALEAARQSRLPYAPICSGSLYLRNTVAGTSSSLERVTQFLRDHVWGGDQIVNLVKEWVYRDAFIEHGAAGLPSAPPAAAPDWPRPAAVDSAQALTTIVPAELGLDLGVEVRGLLLGCWYPVNHATGMYLSVMQPRALPEELLRADRGAVNPLDGVESGALDYLVAMDLNRFDIRFSLGTDEPRVGWSARVAAERRDPNLAGPDGIDSDAPLARTGMVSPALTARVVATFAGGFKRVHGAFLSGPLALQNEGSHYGFMEQGVVFSRLQPGLATLYRRTDGTVDLKTWTQADDALLGSIVDARQNGVPLIDFDTTTGVSRPGALVTKWGPGNWSGSVDERLRTLRAGLCLQETNAGRYLIFGYFSGATPSAMVRVFQAYGCRYAMHLDMNALEHTYFALYVRAQGELQVQHLIQGMAVLDRKGGTQLAPRFLGFPDDRDFFYLVRRGNP
jgi:hypothetical protein